MPGRRLGSCRGARSGVLPTRLTDAGGDADLERLAAVHHGLSVHARLDLHAHVSLFRRTGIPRGCTWCHTSVTLRDDGNICKRRLLTVDVAHLDVGLARRDSAGGFALRGVVCRGGRPIASVSAIRRSTQRKRTDTLVEWLPWVVTAPFLVFAGLRLTGSDSRPVIVALVGLTPLVMIPVWGLLAYGLSRRRWLLVSVTVPLVIAHIAWSFDDATLGRGSRSQSHGATEPLRVVTGNLNVANTLPTSFLSSMLDGDPDVILLQELTPDAWSKIDAMPEMANYPHRVVDPQTTGLGSAILSRATLADGVVELFGVGKLTRASVVVGDSRILVLNVHLTTPSTGIGIDRWRAEHQLLLDRAAEFDGPSIIGGDFNSTGQHDEFRRLLSAGLIDAHDAAGRGLGFTWGATGPALMRLDHLLVTGDIVPLSADVRPGPGSDHRVLDVLIELR